MNNTPYLNGLFDLMDRPIESWVRLLVHTLSALGLMLGLFFAYHAVTGRALPFPQPDNNLWDVVHYHFIVEKGYGADLTRTAFYPLFPFLWKATGFGLLGISILNGLLFIAGFVFLMKELRPTAAQLWLVLSLPFNFFYFVPYSEALFFALTALIIVGFRREKVTWIAIGLLLSAMTRPTSQVYLPALWLTAYCFRGQKLLGWKHVALFTFSALAGQVAVMTLYHFTNGDAFAFFEAQKNWNHHLQPFKLPLTSWSNDMVFTDVHYFYVGLSVVVLTVEYLYHRLRLSDAMIGRFSYLERLSAQPEVTFSLLYLAGITGLVMLFQGGDVHSFSRYLNCTPFFVVFVLYVVPFFRLTGWQYLYFAVGMTVWGVLTMRIDHHPQATINFLFLTGYWLMVAATRSRLRLLEVVAYGTVIAIHLFFGVKYAAMFFRREWVE